MKNVKNSDNYVMLGYDLMTKKVFGDKDDDKPIRILLEIILGIKVKKVEVLNNEVVDKPYIDKKNAVDLLVELDDNTVVGIEINTDVSTLLISRNLFYLFRIASRDLKPSEEYSKLKSHIQINFDFKGVHEFPIMVYSLKEDVTNIELSNKIKILRIDVPFFYDVMYNNDIERLNRFIEKYKLVKLDLESAKRLARFISLFYEKNKTKASEIVKGDEDMSYLYDKVLENSDELIGVYDKESHDKFIREAYMKEQVEQGIKQKENDMVLNLLAQNVSIDIISKASGLSIEEIEELRNSNK